MARNIPNAQARAKAPKSEGSTMGIAPEAAAFSTSPLQHVIPAAFAARASDAPPVRSFRVLAERSVMYDHCRTTMRAGKILFEHQVDVEYLRRQGLQLEEITPAAPSIPPPAEDEGSDESEGESESDEGEKDTGANAE